jgi:hypothetical protein
MHDETILLGLRERLNCYDRHDVPAFFNIGLISFYQSNEFGMTVAFLCSIYIYFMCFMLYYGSFLLKRNKAKAIHFKIL